MSCQHFVFHTAAIRKYMWLCVFACHSSLYDSLAVKSKWPSAKLSKHLLRLSDDIMEQLLDVRLRLSALCLQKVFVGFPAVNQRCVYLLFVCLFVVYFSVLALLLVLLVALDSTRFDLILTSCTPYDDHNYIIFTCGIRTACRLKA